MGKFKVSFSSSEADTGLGIMHDLGVIPVLNSSGQPGFKLLVGGGLGAQPAPADVLHSWIPTEELLPIAEAILRVFDREGERAKRQKARFKFLYQRMGREALLAAIERERAMPSGEFPSVSPHEHQPTNPSEVNPIAAPEGHEQWRKANVFHQKQPGRHGSAFACRWRRNHGAHEALLDALAPSPPMPFVSPKVIFRCRTSSKTTCRWSTASCATMGGMR